jgi:hypothetical protein
MRVWEWNYKYCTLILPYSHTLTLQWRLSPLSNGDFPVRPTGPWAIFNRIQDDDDGKIITIHLEA